MQVEKEREALRFEMNKAAAQMKEADAAIAAQKAELDKLNQIITEADQAGCRALLPVLSTLGGGLYMCCFHALSCTFADWNKLRWAFTLTLPNALL